MVTVTSEELNFITFLLSSSLSFVFSGDKTTADEIGLDFSPLGIKEVSMILSEYGLIK